MINKVTMKLIENSINNRKALVKNIHDLKNKETEIKKSLEELEASCDELVVDFQGINGMSDTITPLTELIEVLEALDKGFDMTITDKFKDAILDFAKTGNISEKTFTQFDPINQQNQSV